MEKSLAAFPGQDSEENSPEKNSALGGFAPKNREFDPTGVSTGSQALGGLTRGSYAAHVTVYPYNGYIRSTNPIVRHVRSLTWTTK